MCRCIFTGRRHLRKNNKRALQCARCLTKLKAAGSILTYAHIPSPHWRQRRKSHRDAVDITLKKLASVTSIRLRGTVMAANRKTRHNNTVTSRHYGRRAIFIPGDVRFQDGDTFDLSKGGGRFLPLLPRSFNVLLALAYFAIRYTRRTTVVLWYDGLRDIRVLFMHDASQSAWRITPIRFNNVRLSPLIFRPNISGLLRPRVLKPLHYPTRASRNEVSNVRAIEVGLHSTQVSNSCRKWNRIFIFLFSFTVHCIYGAYHSSMSCLNVSSSFPPMPRQRYVWTVSNLTFVLLSFKLRHSTTEVPFIVLAIYSLRSGTQKRINGDATRAVCRLRKDVSEALYAIPCDKRRSFAYRLDLLCSVILFVGCTMCVASAKSMII